MRGHCSTRWNLGACWCKAADPGQRQAAVFGRELDVLTLRAQSTSADVLYGETLRIDERVRVSKRVW
jgi:hypothetical protein